MTEAVDDLVATTASGFFHCFSSALHEFLFVSALKRSRSQIQSDNHGLLQPPYTLYTILSLPYSTVKRLLRNIIPERSLIDFQLCTQESQFLHTCLVRHGKKKNIFKLFFFAPIPKPSFNPFYSPFKNLLSDVQRMI